MNMEHKVLWLLEEENKPHILVGLHPKILTAGLDVFVAVACV